MKAIDENMKLLEECFRSRPYTEDIVNIASSEGNMGEERMTGMESFVLNFFHENFVSHKKDPRGDPMAIFMPLENF